MPATKATRVSHGAVDKRITARAGTFKETHTSAETFKETHKSSVSRLAHSRVTLADGSTCVMLPEDEYEHLMEIAEAQELVAKLEDPRAEWVDLDEYKLQLAGSKIAAARKAKGLTQTQLAKRLHLPQSQISRIERNPDRTTVRTLKRIGKALGVDVRSLVN